MARRISDEDIIQINEVYYLTHNKSLTAKTVGVSPSTVSRYIIDNYIPIAERENINYTFDKEPLGANSFIDYIKSQDNPTKAFCNFCKLSQHEWEELKELQKEIII